jgi:hypothetical protein
MKDLFKKLLNDLSSKDVISEERKDELNILFETKIKEYKEKIFEDALESVDEKHIALLDKVVSKIDEDHTESLDKVLSKIDEDHTELLEGVLSKIDEDHTVGLKMVVEKYENGMQEELEGKVSDFLDVYIEDKLPEGKIVDTVRLEKLEEMFNEIKQIALISEISMDEEIKEAVQDAKTIIEDKDAEINTLMFDKIELSKKLKRNEASNLLEDKCKNINPKMRAYIETRFKDADVDEIEDKFEEAIEAFEEDETLLREELKDQATSNVNPKKILTEGVADDKTKNSNTSDMMNHYIDRFKRSNKYNH